jgi:hypothetical protein
MKINMSEYFPITPEELNEFENFVENSTVTPPDDGFERLLAAKDANEKFISFQKGLAKPSSIGMLVEILANAIGKNRFRFADELQIDGSTWNKVILGQNRPDILPANIYAAFAKAYNITLHVLKNALEGSFHLIQTGTTATAGSVYARSDRKTTMNSDVTAAMHELLRKAGRTEGALDQKAMGFLKEIESCMKTKK